MNATENLANLFSLLRAPRLWVVCAISLQLELCSLLSVSQALLWDSLDSALTQFPSRQINAELPFLFIRMGFPIFHILLKTREIQGRVVLHIHFA